ncbi:MAG: hypothetical protein IJ563_09715 [Selenomonadaceae bacterium]|nr:hypothetical protein [Selenomonadaceae bacterium]
MVYKNTRVIPFKEGEEIIDKNETMREAEYRAKLDRSIKQLNEGKGQIHELIEVDANR